MFTLVAELHDYRVDYDLYDIEGFFEGETKGVYDRPVWHKAGDPCSSITVDTLEEAEPYLQGKRI